MITRLGKQKLEETIYSLQKELERVVEERRLAAAEGDLRENSAYIFLTERSQVLSTQISELSDELKSSKVQPMPSQVDRIEFGHTVSVIFKEDGRQLTITLVGKHDARLKPGWTSVESPIGMALLGHKKGDTVEVNSQELTILSISSSEDL